MLYPCPDHLHMLGFFKRSLEDSKKKGESSSAFVFSCTCGIMRELGGPDLCPRCGRKMRKRIMSDK